MMKLKEKTNIIYELGYMDKGTGKHQSNTVYDTRAICPALTTIQGGTQQIKVLEFIDDGRKGNQDESNGYNKSVG